MGGSGTVPLSPPALGTSGAALTRAGGLPGTVPVIRAELARRELARRSYAEYLAYVGGPGWKRTRFVEHLAAQVQEFVEAETGNAYDILLIESPPQHGKSMAVTESLPSWWLGRHPGGRVILASYNDESAERFARRNREKIRDFGRVLFGLELDEVKRRNEFGVASGGIRGSLISRGIMAGITGRPGDLIVIDDPIKNRQEADSPTTRRRVWAEWVNSIKTRLSAGAKVVVIMTPWHEDDLAGRLQAAEPGLKLLRLPVEAEEDDPLGRAPGDPLCPELGKGRKWLEQFKESYLNDPEGGARAWSALYQCSPRVETGNMVHRDWWRYYKPAEAPAFATTLISVDATFKGGEENDFVAIEVWGKTGNDYYLRYCLNRHMDFPQTMAAIRTVRQLYPAVGPVLIEDKANGSAIVSVLQKEMFCIPVTPNGGKEARVNAIAPAIESGHVHLPEGEPWLEEFVDQFTAFPAGKHDDMVDAASQALSYMIWSSGDRAQALEPEQEEEADAWDEYDVYGVG